MQSSGYRDFSALIRLCLDPTVSVYSSQPIFLEQILVSDEAERDLA
jgi:hypothetical protein